ncbi:tRNA1(Val) (adenine(37)-N6)-methyltransferase [Inquilinus sp. Marseille-Q2685]|uniref:tRNA1(Val) (adenine(37)-N6)-methyltransferase n=1 Tax=Inquilinus sp. Marseille-Q2685 TaxID=2866581 RepID=UPI001CE41CC1|nr:methyltransferase [Inquilinus sp. Marseille-Q2685]
MPEAANRAASEDRLLDGRVRLRQPRDGYRAAIDPVLLAAAVPAAPGERVADLGCGVGAALLCLAARCPEVSVTGVERDPGLAALARENLGLNGLGGRAAIVEGSVADSIPGAPFDRVMMNPPFLPPGRGRASAHPVKAAANVEDGLDLAGWVVAAARVLKPRGWLTLIHRADRVDEICTALRPGFGSLTLFPLWPRAGEAARRVLVQARRGGRAPAVLAAGLVLHEAGGGFTPAAQVVLRDAAPLTL